jgi:DNA-binding NtrC family response regulator
MEVSELEALSRWILDVLAARSSPALEVSWQPRAEAPSRCDLMVLPVHEPSLASAKTEISRLRATLPACSLIVVCVDLLGEQLEALLGSGPFDFVQIPFSDDELCMRVQRAAGLLPSPRRPDDTDAIARARAHDLIGSSACFVKQLGALPVLAGCDACVLILGETGTGKELFARTIHYLSARASRPLVAVNCGAIPVDLMETELFGCVRGAYTSAHAARSGLVREAEGGTLFLDEIDALPLSAQTKLLRFVQEKEYRPVGSGAALRADVRVIAASNHDLAALVEEGAFRRDLYFRLNVLKLTLPALRERREDIAELARYFTEQCCRKAHRGAIRLTAPAMRKLLAHEWSGNVRELGNAIERAVLFCQGSSISGDDIQLGDARDDDAESFREAKARTVSDFERGYIERMLSVHEGNITRAASAAQKNRRAFFALMRKHAIAPDRFRGAAGRAR